MGDSAGGGMFIGGGGAAISAAIPSNPLTLDAYIPGRFGQTSQLPRAKSFAVPGDYSSVGTSSRQARGDENFSPDAPMVTRMPNLQTNSRVMYTRIAAAYSDLSPLALPQRYQLVLVRKDYDYKGPSTVGPNYYDDEYDDDDFESHNALMPYTSGGVRTHLDRVMEQGPLSHQGIKARRVTAMTVPVWNFKAAEYATSNPPRMPSQVLSAEEVWGMWSVDGAVCTEAGERGFNESYPGVDHSAQERVLNNVVSGFAFMHSLWPGDNIRCGTPCFLILKQVDFQSGDLLRGNMPQYIIDNRVSEGITYDFSNEGTKAKRRRLEASDKPLLGQYNDVDNYPRTVKPFQLIPFADDMYDWPPLEALRYEDEFGLTHYGIAIPVGRFQYPTSASRENRTLPSSSGGYGYNNWSVGTSQFNRRLALQAPFSIQALTAQPQTWFFLSP